MKCKICRQKSAVLRLHSYNLNLCADCFDTFLLRRVEKAIKSYKMFGQDANLLLAVSGGKDSLVLWHVLNRLGYKVDGFYVDLGIGNYSVRSKDLAQQFAQTNGLKLIIESVKEQFQAKGIIEINKITRRKACSVCGTVKRYLFNKIAIDNNYDVLLTGHNLDDEAATLFGNFLNWQVEYMARQYPVLIDEAGFLKKKVKPLIYVSEYETTTYAVLNGISYITEECPLSKNATSLFYKSTLNKMELKRKGLKLSLVKGFLKNRSLFSMEEQRPELQKCNICGFATTSETCSFCRLKQHVFQKSTHE